MNIKNIFKNSVTPETNNVTADEWWQSTLLKFGIGEYSDTILKMAISPLFDELKKIEFYGTDERLSEICNFLNSNYTTIFKYLFKKGYCGVKLNNLGQFVFDKVITVKSSDEFQKELTNPNSVSSFEFDFFGKSQFELLRVIFEQIDTGLSAQKAITKILGQFTFFSRETLKDNERPILLTDEERKKFGDKFNGIFNGETVGTAIEFTNANLKRDTIVFPLEKLQIIDTVSFMILIVAGVLNIPYDLIPISGKSTYQNQELAVQYLRDHTVAGIAENFLELGRKMLKMKYPLLPKNALDYRIIIDVNKHSTI